MHLQPNCQLRMLIWGNSAKFWISVSDVFSFNLSILEIWIVANKPWLGYCYGSSIHQQKCLPDCWTNHTFPTSKLGVLHPNFCNFPKLTISNSLHAAIAQVCGGVKVSRVWIFFFHSTSHTVFFFKHTELFKVWQLKCLVKVREVSVLKRASKTTLTVGRRWDVNSNLRTKFTHFVCPAPGVAEV